MVRKLVNYGVITTNVIGTRETCWKLHGRSPNVKKKGESRVLQATSDQEPQSSSNAFSFTKEHLDQMYKLLESQTPSCSMAQKGNFPESAHLSVISNRTWIVDSGATDHMTRESSLFSSYKPCAGNSKIKIADGSLSAVAAKSSIVFPKFGTCNTFWMVSKGDKTIELFPAMAEKEPSTILILELPAHGLNEENKLDSQVMLSVDPKSTIHVRLGMTLR